MSDSNNRLKESLSALMDDAADELEIQRVLKAVEEDDEMRATWERYQLASSAMHSNAPARPMDLSASIAAALDDEPAHKVSNGAFQSLGRVAIAAAVTVAVVIGVQQSGVIGDADTVPQVATATDSALPSEFATPISTAPVSYQGYQELTVESLSELDEHSKRELEARLNELLQRQAEKRAQERNQRP